MRKQLFSDDSERLAAHEEAVNKFLSAKKNPAESAAGEDGASISKRVDAALSVRGALNNNEMVSPASLKPIKELFVVLPQSSQDQIIADIEAGRDKGNKPEELIARAYKLIKVHLDFAKLGLSDAGDDLERQNEAEQVLEEILRNLKDIRNKRKEKEVNQMNFPFEESPKESGDGWVN